MTRRILLWPRGDEKDQAYLVGRSLLRSRSIGMPGGSSKVNVNFFIFNPFPIPRPSRDDPRWQRVVALAGRLAAPDHRFAAWAKAVGVEHGKLPEDEKQDMIAELDALAARLYGLTERQLTHVFETFHEGWDYETRLRAVLKHFRAHGRTSVT